MSSNSQSDFEDIESNSSSKKTMEEDYHSLKIVPLGNNFELEIRPIIDLVDELRGCGIHNDIDLPAVVVVGDQSSGKSSILEALSGVELPRGSGIVTRCPLRMEMKRADGWSASISTDDVRGIRQIDNPGGVRQAIIDAQNQIAGKSKMISRQEIVLRISSPTAADLTLIDLPGITRIAVESQPDDMPEQIRELVKEYIERENTIILCAISGNLDIAVNESIKLAQQVDPTGVRTLGVITKPDIIDSQDSKRNTMRLLQGELIAMKKGFIIVRCRSSEDAQRISLSDALEKETQFFRSDPVFKHADKVTVGVPNLSNNLTKNLVELIRRKIPEMKENIGELRMEARRQLDELPLGPPDDEALLLSYCINITHKFEERAKKCVVNGEVKYIGWEKKGNSYNTWREMFNEFSEGLDSKTADLVENQQTQDFLAVEVKQRRGDEISDIFVRWEIIRDPVKKHIESYLDIVEQCMEKINRHLSEVMNILIEKHFQHLPDLKIEIERICNSVQRQQEEITRAKLKQHLKEEKVLFCQDVLFAKEMAEAKKSNKEDDEMGKQPERISEIHLLLKTYLKVANRRISDNIPACILRSMHNEFIKSLRERLDGMFKTEEILKFAKEREDLANQRKKLFQRLERLQTAEERLCGY